MKQALHEAEKVLWKRWSADWEVAEMIEAVLSNIDNEAVIKSIRERANKTMERYSLFAD